MQFDTQPVLASEVLVLRPLTAADFEELRLIASDPLLWEQHPAKDRAGAAGFRRWFDQALAQGALVAVDRSSGDMIGTSRYAVHDQDALVEIGWTFLARSRWGGYWNAEMKRLMLAHAFASFATVGFAVHEDNVRSQRAVARLGAVRVATSPDQHGRGHNVLFHLHRHQSTASRTARTAGAVPSGPRAAGPGHTRRLQMSDDDIVQPYDEEWAAMFAAERERLLAVLRPWLSTDIEHVGSTSVPGMAAKPVIDMLAGVHDLQAARQAVTPLAALDYAYRPHRPEALLFDRPRDAAWQDHTHHLHLTEPGSDLWRERLAFRDALREDPELVAEYSAWKRRHRLAGPDGPYNASKTPFVAQVLARAGIPLKPDEQRRSPDAD